MLLNIYIFRLAKDLLLMFIVRQSSRTIESVLYINVVRPSIRKRAQMDVIRKRGPFLGCRSDSRDVPSPPCLVSIPPAAIPIASAHHQSKLADAA